ncbi:C40 family peptidase [Lysobacter sp. HDW10]|uniref:C40 family peptidase n=1 Tax=Lysobacter sp. HDW10 TaxID=2714936 RepID=UPI001407E76B|nr:C40 family peptidase [Lysobacter sp. HDW10]QIK81940.1 C40 family peptidase [Lysobacter sp. HDW10]
MKPVHIRNSCVKTLIFLALCTPLTVLAAPGEDNNAEPPSTAQGWNVRMIHGQDAVNAVLIRAISLVGTPYQWGGATPGSGFDCSGLVNFVFKDMLNVQLPRTSRELAEAQGPRIDFDDLKPGDLVFFGANGVVSHVGIYIGERRFIHAPRTGTVVRLEQIDKSYWTGRYTGARRVIET